MHRRTSGISINYGRGSERINNTISVKIRVCCMCWWELGFMNKQQNLCGEDHLMLILKLWWSEKAWDPLIGAKFSRKLSGVDNKILKQNASPGCTDCRKSQSVLDQNDDDDDAPLTTNEY